MSDNKGIPPKLKIFSEFIVFGIIMGLVENIIAIFFSTDQSINSTAIIISLVVVIPFASIGELWVDRTDLLSRTNKRAIKRLEVVLEFLTFGVLMGVVEDLIVIGLITGGAITLQTVGIVTVVTLPFAIIGEVIVDRYNWLPGQNKP